MKRVLLSVVVALVTGSALAVTFVPIVGDISVTTSPNRSSAAITISNNGVAIAQFCVSFPDPLDQSISIKERGQVIYLPRPIEGLPPGMQINGPEPIAQTLTVVPEKSPALAFVAKGVKPIHSNAKVIVISNVTRQDWEGPNDTRHVPGVGACLDPGG